MKKLMILLAILSTMLIPSAATSHPVGKSYAATSGGTWLLTNHPAFTSKPSVCSTMQSYGAILSRRCGLFTNTGVLLWQGPVRYTFIGTWTTDNISTVGNCTPSYTCHFRIITSPGPAFGMFVDESRAY